MIGEKIRLLRKKHGYSQKQFAEKLKVSQAAVSGWETGIRNINLETLDQIAFILNEPLKAFLEDVADPVALGRVVRTEEGSDIAIDADDIDFMLEGEMDRIIDKAAFEADKVLLERLSNISDRFLLNEIVLSFRMLNRIGRFELYRHACKLVGDDVPTLRYDREYEDRLLSEIKKRKEHD